MNVNINYRRTGIHCPGRDDVHYPSSRYRVANPVRLSNMYIFAMYAIHWVLLLPVIINSSSVHDHDHWGERTTSKLVGVVTLFARLLVPLLFRFRTGGYLVRFDNVGANVP